MRFSLVGKGRKKIMPFQIFFFLLSSHACTYTWLPWFSPSQQQSTTWPLAHSSPPWWDGEKNQKKKVKLTGWDKDSLIGQQRKRKIVTLIQEHTKWVMHIAITHHPAHSQAAIPAPPRQLSQFIHQAWCHTVSNTPFASLGQLSWLCPPPASCEN